MELHPQSREVLNRMSAWGSAADRTVDEYRERDRLRWTELAGEPQQVASVDELQIPTQDGGVRALVYRPHDGHGRGIVLWLHGGGFICGSPEHSDDQVRALANASGCVVVSLDYRLAPEHPFPAAPHDCYAAVRWIAEHREDLGAPEAKLVVAGDSAGANLAAVVTLMARDAGGPRIAYQVLVYPVTCHAIDTPSRRDFGEGYGLARMIGPPRPSPYLPNVEDGRSPLASPLLAESLVKLPPALVVTAEFDPLRDEGELYARRLQEAGVAAGIRRYEGMLHGFVAFGGVVDEAWTALRDAGFAIRHAVGAPVKAEAG